MFYYELPPKQFKVALDSLRSWAKSNLPGVELVRDDNDILGESGSIVTVVFNEEPSYEYLTGLDDYWAALTDDGSSYAAEVAKNQALMLEELKIQYGIKVRAFLGYLCELNNFTPTEYGQILADTDLAFCSTLLISGALESCKAIIDAYTPTAYFTSDMKTEMSAELQKYITLV